MSGKRPATIAVDLLGDYVVNSPWLSKSFTNIAAPTYSSAPYPYPNAQPNLTPITKSYNLGQIAVGGKYKPWKNLILYGNVTFQLNEVGLRSSPVPLVGASYTFF